ARRDDTTLVAAEHPVPADLRVEMDVDLVDVEHRLPGACAGLEPTEPLQNAQPSLPPVPTSAETGSPWKLVSEGGEWIPTRAQAIPSPHPIGTEPLAIEGRGSRSRDREQACARQEAQVHRRREVADRARGRRVHRARSRRGASATK